MRLLSAACLLMLSGAAVAQPAAPDPARKQAERDLFEKVVEIPTVAGRTAEFKRMTALLTAEFRKAGITNVIVKDHDGTQSLIARWPAAKPSGKKPILLMAHMDVVEAKAADWKNPPFEFRELGGYYLGRGSHDNKAALTGIVLALQDLKRSGFQPTRDIVVLFTGDEETGGKGAERAATEWRPLIDAEYALNGDAGGGALYKDGRVESFGMQIAEKTYADYKFVATNRGGHSSAPRPDNAIYALATAIKAVETHRFPPMINAATRAAYEQTAAKDGGQYGELVKAWLADPNDRERADMLEAMDPGYTRTRCVATMLSGRARAQRLAAAGRGQRQLPDIPGRQGRGDPRRVAGDGGVRRDRAVAEARPSPTPARCARTSPPPIARRSERGSRMRRSSRHVGRRDRRLLPAQRRDPGLWLWRAVGDRRRTRGRPRARRARADRRVPRPGADLGRDASPPRRKLIAHRLRRLCAAA